MEWAVKKQKKQINPPLNLSIETLISKVSFSRETLTGATSAFALQVGPSLLLSLLLGTVWSPTSCPTVAAGL